MEDAKGCRCGHISIEHAGAFLIGHELSTRIDEREQSIIEAFLTKLLGETDEYEPLDSMLRQGPRIWREEPESYRACAIAMQRGLGCP